jgi:hypothetical protein
MAKAAFMAASDLSWQEVPTMEGSSSNYVPPPPHPGHKSYKVTFMNKAGSSDNLPPSPANVKDVVQ